MQDSLQAFIINQEEYRGIIVHLDKVYHEIASAHAYPEPIQRLLGEALVAVSLLGHNLKQEGKLALQIETEGCIKLLVVEINDKRGIRGLVQWRDDIPPEQNMLGAGRFAITITPKHGDRYQGVVPMVGHNIAKSLEAYFNQSEQIFSRILLSSNGKHAAGMFIQKLPLEKEPELDADTLNLLLDTVRGSELIDDSNDKLLHKLFHQYKVDQFEHETIHFECTCTREKMENAVRLLGKEDALQLLSTHKAIEVSCDFCNHNYSFDKHEVENIFSS